MKNIIAIRHAEAEHLIKKVIGGRNETSVTLTGEKQALHTAIAIQEIMKDSLPVIYSSDQLRAVQTAEHISNTLKSKVIFSHQLRSIDNGVAKHMSPSEAEQTVAPMVNPRIDWVPWAESESWRMLFRRVSNYMEQLSDTKENIIIVTHGRTLVALFQWWMGYSEEQLENNFFQFETDPCGITHLSMADDGERFIHKLNCTNHLIKGVE